MVSPDVGGVARARAFAKKLSDAPLAIVDKRRQGHNLAEVVLCMELYCSIIYFSEVTYSTQRNLFPGSLLMFLEN